MTDSGRPPVWRVVGPTLIGWMDAALMELEAHAELLDRWNVFPVADGDTGRNMLATLRAGVEAMHEDGDDGLPGVLKRLADGAVRGAGGNPGRAGCLW